MQISMRPLALLHVFMLAIDAFPQAGTTTCFPTMWASETTSSTSSLEPRESSIPQRMKTLSLCCCCMATPPYAFDEPEPTLPDYMGDCSKEGTRDVCGSNYTGSSGFSMNGLEGHPDMINAQCSISRCGAMRFVD
ncbi:hypothetical protein GGR55DRAFT_631905 [Xylaria sp. FL0064]|nr:hypothetical protein GGR55DRAFT_631905 [Xylaria sp. FL0064]